MFDGQSADEIQDQRRDDWGAILGKTFHESIQELW